MSPLPLFSEIDAQWSRPWTIPASFSALALTCQCAWETSIGHWQTIQASLSQVVWPAEIDSLWLAGSFARRETGPHSDLDPLVITAKGVSPQHPVVQTAAARFRDILSQTGLKLPQSSGIYTQPIARDELLEPRRMSRLDEDFATYGTRMALLVEAQPVTALAAARLLQTEILQAFELPESYSLTGVRHYRLTQELVRYAKSLALRYQHELRDDPVRWRVRQLKGRFSRQLWYWGLMCLLEMSQSVSDHEQQSWWTAHLALTPLERIAHRLWGNASATCPPPARTEWLVAYERFLATLQHPDFPAMLQAETTSDRVPDLGQQPVFAGLLRDSQAISHDVTQSLWDSDGGEWISHILS